MRRVNRRLLVSRITGWHDLDIPGSLRCKYKSCSEKTMKSVPKWQVCGLPWALGSGIPFFVAEEEGAIKIQGVLIGLLWVFSRQVTFLSAT